MIRNSAGHTTRADAAGIVIGVAAAGLGAALAVVLGSSHAAAAQALPAVSYWHDDEQQSPSSALLSSHCSPGSRMPFPHGMPPGQKPDG